MQRGSDTTRARAKRRVLGAGDPDELAAGRPLGRPTLGRGPALIGPHALVRARVVILSGDRSRVRPTAGSDQNALKYPPIMEVVAKARHAVMDEHAIGNELVMTVDMKVIDLLGDWHAGDSHHTSGNST